MASDHTPDYTARQREEREKFEEAMSNRPMCAARELTIGELLDRRIEKAERTVRALCDLKASLPGTYLNSGASRIGALLEI